MGSQENYVGQSDGKKNNSSSFGFAIQELPSEEAI